MTEKHARNIIDDYTKCETYERDCFGLYSRTYGFGEYPGWYPCSSCSIGNLFNGRHGSKYEVCKSVYKRAKRLFKKKAAAEWETMETEERLQIINDHGSYNRWAKASPEIRAEVKAAKKKAMLTAAMNEEYLNLSKHIFS